VEVTPSKEPQRADSSTAAVKKTAHPVLLCFILFSNGLQGELLFVTVRFAGGM
jgi:hypothetical protein